MKSIENTDGDGESSNHSTANANLAAHMATVVQARAPFAPGAHWKSIGNPQQNIPSVLDPAVVNVAATIAAATAQAVHQANHALGAQSASANSIVEVLGRNQMLGHNARQVQLSSVAQIAAMLTTPGVHQAANFHNPNAASLQPFMNLGGALQSSQTQAPLPNASAVAPNATVTSAQAQNMQSWSAAQLEKHASLLQQLNRPIPQYVGLLLTEARRKQKKKNAKRIANRRSASTSRARKKKYVEEMKVMNARLKRQALILSLIPDMVIAIGTDGEITFCSAQVERILKHKIDGLVGAKLSNLLVPESQDALRSLIIDMVNGNKDRSPVSAQPAGCEPKKRATGADTDRTKVAVANRNGDGNGSADNTPNAAIVSEQSFPPSVVEVESKQAGNSSRINAEQNDNSDSSTNNSNGKARLSSLTNSSTRSPTASSGDDQTAREGGSADGSANTKQVQSSDDSSSLSSDAKNMSKANENLIRNVRIHNQKLMHHDGKKGPKDDVRGASVTRNNATARLSSLKHFPDSSKTKDGKGVKYDSIGDQSSSDDSLLAGVEEKKKAAENASDDSGYRESNDSREETSSSGSDTSNSNEQRKKPLTSTCRMCLIRQDLTTVWCEVTSSVRTRFTDEESCDSPSNPSKSSATPPEPAASREDGLEILLCLRPISNGEKSVDESFRFIPVQGPIDTTMDETVDRVVSFSSSIVNKTESSSGSGSVSKENSSAPQSSSEKRTLQTDEDTSKPQSKKQRRADGSKPSTLETEQAVETLMFLNKSSQ